MIIVYICGINNLINPDMKKLLVIAAFMAFGYFGATAHTATSVPVQAGTVTVAPDADKAPKADAKADKKDKSEMKAKECAPADKKQCGTKRSCCAKKSEAKLEEKPIQ